ncbi:MAG: hypothetical protein IJJ99_04135 [Oscillospiraceae bacterium]|nr:hypothetical protein [Oscillospiraceae bacterium]
MKKNYGFILFLGVFLLMCLWPLVGMAIAGPSAAAANEKSAPLPALTKGGAFNASFLNDTSDYFADHFASRQELITVNAVLEAALFGESAEENVILGKDGWLYYKSTLEDYQGQNLLSDREIWAAAHCLALVQEYAREQNADFLFTVAPNKNTLYPESMPDRYLRSDVSGNAERLYDALRSEGVRYVDLEAAFCAEDRVLYQRLDSHWNNLGAALAHDTILDALGMNAARFYAPDHFTAAEDHDADLYQMLFPAGTEKDVQFYPDWSWQFSYDRPIRSAEDQKINTCCSGQNGRLLMFRDSFGNTLYPFMAESFGAACFSRAMPYDLSLLGTEDADTLVIEIVERNIARLAQNAPQYLPAPVREIPLPDVREPSLRFTCSFSPAENGTVRCSGNLRCAPDTNSPVFLVCDGTVYEASPAGSGEYPFTAYLPEQPASLQIMFLQNGKLIISQEILN